MSTILIVALLLLQEILPRVNWPMANTIGQLVANVLAAFIRLRWPHAAEKVQRLGSRPPSSMEVPAPFNREPPLDEGGPLRLKKNPPPVDRLPPPSSPPAAARPSWMKKDRGAAHLEVLVVLAGIVALVLAIAGCASSNKVTAGAARGLDAFAVGMVAADAQLPKAARPPTYLKIRDDCAAAIAAAAPLLPAGCASSLSSAAALALAGVPAAYAKFYALVHPPASHAAALDPALQAALIQASAAFAPPLIQGLGAIILGAQAAAAQAQADCAAAVSQVQLDAAQLQGKLAADDATAVGP